MKRALCILFFYATVCLAIPCSEWVLLGVGNPNPNGRSGVANLLRVGDTSTNPPCNDQKYLIDVGRGAVVQLSKVDGLIPNNLTATFITHMHSDHVTDIFDLIQTTALDAIPQSPATPFVIPAGDVKFETDHALDPYISDINQRRNFVASFNPQPQYLSVFTPTNEPQVVYTNGDMTVESIFVFHAMNVSVAYRFNTPAASIVFGGDERIHDPPNFAIIAAGADIVVMDPFLDATIWTTVPIVPPFFPIMHTNSTELGQVCAALNTPVVALTHLMPAPGDTKYNLFGPPIPFGPVSVQHYQESVQGRGGYNGQLIVGDDLTSIKYAQLQITGFQLVDSQGNVLMALSNNQQIDASTLPSNSRLQVILGNGAANVQSVVFTIGEFTHTDSSAPFNVQLDGDNLQGTQVFHAQAQTSVDGGWSGVPATITLNFNNRKRHAQRNPFVPEDSAASTLASLSLLLSSVLAYLFF